MPVTLEELAKAAGVSVSTVSRAVTPGAHPVNEATRARILALAQELGYRPNLVARSLRTERTRTVGIIVDSIVSPFSPLIIRGVQDYLKAHKYHGVIINADWNPDAETAAIHDLISRSIDGVIFVESWLRGASQPLDVAGKPYVFVHRLFSRDETNSVRVDDVFGARLAVSHLADLGHRRIAFIAGPPGWDAAENRLVGYREMLVERGLRFEPELVFPGDWELQKGYAAVGHLLALAQRPTAIFAANDLMALGAIYALQEASLRVPEDMAVVGYDDREIASLSRPTITTVTLPCYEMGQASARLLLSMLDQSVEPPENNTIQGRLIVRESCGATEGRMTAAQIQTYTTPNRLRGGSPAPQ